MFQVVSSFVSSGHLDFHISFPLEVANQVQGQGNVPERLVNELVIQSLLCFNFDCLYEVYILKSIFFRLEDAVILIKILVESYFRI
mmetsp:Transcript_11435/g.10097  ORF Transcript_11435/g.10097 Transcript_11435/m.10097 type:complete len:86 (-) Transcript_11435:1142-1399(-)